MIDFVAKFSKAVVDEEERSRVRRQRGFFICLSRRVSRLGLEVNFGKSRLSHLRFTGEFPWLTTGTNLSDFAAYVYRICAVAWVPSF